MNLFRSRKHRQVSSAPLPDWDDTRWRSHLRSNSLGTDHHCNIYLEMINTDRKEAARLFKNEDYTGARMYAESSLRNRRIVDALAALSPLCNALFQRAEPLAGYTSLVQIPEPARSGIVTIIFAAGRLQLSYLTDTVSFLREQFGHIHIDDIQSSQGELSNLVNSKVRNALSPTPPEQNEVDSELVSAVKEYFGISVSPAVSRRNTGNNTNTNNNHNKSNNNSNNNNQQNSNSVVLSNHSSELGVPESPQFSATSAQQQQHVHHQERQMINKSINKGGPTIPQQGHDEEDDDDNEHYNVRGRIGSDFNDNIDFRNTIDQFEQREANSQQLENDNYNKSRLSMVRSNNFSSATKSTEKLDDSDQALVSRYNDLRSAIAV